MKEGHGPQGTRDVTSGLRRRQGEVKDDGREATLAPSQGQIRLTAAERSGLRLATRTGVKQRRVKHAARRQIRRPTVLERRI